jgi:hypothetical protein
MNAAFPGCIPALAILLIALLIQGHPPGCQNGLYVAVEVDNTTVTRLRAIVLQGKRE